MSVARRCWCGSPIASWELEFDLPDQGLFTMVHCDGCGVLALHPQPTDEQLRVAYSPEYYGSSAKKFVGPVAKVIGWFQSGRARFASRHLPAGGRLLDVGCGNGGFLLQMKQRGFAVEGTEWSAESAARVKSIVGDGIHVHVGDLTDLQLPAASLDLITLWHVFEHLRDPHAALIEIRRLLKPGGSLLMSMPNAESDQARQFGQHWLHHDPPRHLFGFGPSSLGKLLGQSGFAIADLHTKSLEQNPFGFIQSRLNQRAASHGGRRDALYESLKGLRTTNSKGGAFHDLLNGGMLLPVAILKDWRESRRKSGATMTVVLRPHG